MRTVEAVVEEVRSLPVPDRLRLVERIVHEIAEASAGPAPPRTPKASLVGWLADEPEVADRLGELMAEVRAQGRPREVEDENPG
jgi:hypothetical protein